MAIAFTGQIVSAQSTSSVASFTTSAITVTAANAIVSSMCVNASTTLTASDSKSDSYSQSVIRSSSATGQSVAISVATGIAGGSTTFTVTPGVSGFCSISAAEYSGMAASPKEATNNGENTASTAVNPGAVNPASSNDLYVSAWTHNGSSNQTFTFNVSGEGWNQRANLTSTTDQPLGSQDLIASGSKTGSATLSSSAGWDAVVGTFKATAAGGDDQSWLPRSVVMRNAPDTNIFY